MDDKMPIFNIGNRNFFGKWPSPRVGNTVIKEMTFVCLWLFVSLPDIVGPKDCFPRFHILIYHFDEKFQKRPFQILVELTQFYGASSYSMTDIYTRLRQQPFPNLGEVLEIVATKLESFNSENKSIWSNLQSMARWESNKTTKIKRIRRPIGDSVINSV